MVKRFWSHQFSPTTLMFILLGMILFSFNVVESNLISEKKILEARRKINQVKSSAVRTIQSEDGDIIDCIDIYKQPAFDHPMLRNHTIQMTPNMKTSEEMNSLKKKQISQLWQKHGSCPKGTVPIRRLNEKELLKADSIEDYGRKRPAFSSPVEQLNKEEYLRFSNRSTAILLTEGYSYSGVKGDIKVWNPHVESDDEYSTSQVSLKSGPYYDFESLESGWAVNPSVYGDRQTRLFVYWTADASRTTGCFDMTCPGFVQTSHEIALGAAISPVSVPFALPFQITIYIFRDPETNNWWVQYGESINLGYWPPELFTLLHGNAQSAEWGGEVYSTKLGRPPHTTTQMGNGQFPDYIDENSGYVKRMRIRENSLSLKRPGWVSSYSDEYFCYGVQYVEDYVEDPEFYYGGPGQNYKCP